MNGRDSGRFGARSRSFVHEPAGNELRAAIPAVTRALAATHDHDEVLELVREHATLRSELRGLEENSTEQPRRERVA
jgi:hypothetical protein